MSLEAAEPDAGLQFRAKVFISYSRKDMAFADRLESALKVRGFEPLIDRTEIYAFEDWWKRIEALIARADTVVFVLSPDSAASEVARKEVAFAASLNKRFAPIVVRPVANDAVPEALAKLNFVFFDDEARFEASADRLAEALDTDIDWIRQHTAFGEQARQWASAKAPSGLLLRSPALERAERWIAARPRTAPAPTEETKVFITASRQGTTWRRNILTGSLAAGLVLALGLAGLAYWQRGLAVEQRSIAVEQRGIAEQNEAQAKEERDKATRNFKLAQKTAESLVFDIAQGLRDVQGMSAEAVRKILETARATFEQLAAAAPDDPTLQRSRAGMLNQFGDTYRTLGDLDQALAAYRDALAIVERLVATDRSKAEWWSDLSDLYISAGDVFQAQGKLDDALGVYRSSLAIRERLAANDRGDTSLQREVSIAYERIGSVLEKQAKLDEALEAYRNALVIAERLAASDPANTGWQNDLSSSYYQIGDILLAQGKLDDALKAYRDSLAIAERLAASDRSNTRLQRSLTVRYTRVGNVLVAQGKLDDALKVYRDCVAIAERLLTTDRSNTLWQTDLSVFYNKVGEVLLAQGNLDEALKAYRDGLVIAERLAVADRSNTEWQHGLAAGYSRVGEVLVAQGELDEALKAYRDALAVVERLVAADRSNTSWQHDLSVLHGRIGSVLKAQGKIDEALKAYRDGLVIAEQLAATDRSNTRWQHDQSIMYDRVGELLEAQGKLDDALASYRASLAIRERLTKADPRNATLQRDLQASIDLIGDIALNLVLARNFATALACADQVIALASDQIWLHTNRAHALMFLGRVEEARATYLRYRGEARVQGVKPWETVILEDFVELRRAGLVHPLMNEIETLFSSRG